jgi:hypothetical protein
MLYFNRKLHKIMVSRAVARERLNLVEQLYNNVLTVLVNMNRLSCQTNKAYSFEQRQMLASNHQANSTTKGFLANNISFSFSSDGL